MGERVGDDVSLRLPHDPVVADRGGRVHRFLDIPFLEKAGGPVGVVGPDAGQEISLELEADHETVELLLLQPVPLGHDFVRDPEQVLDMVADFVGDDVGQGEIAPGFETVLHLLEKVEIDVDPFVPGTIKRSGGGAGEAASRGDPFRKKNELRLPVGAPGFLRRGPFQMSSVSARTTPTDRPSWISSSVRGRVSPARFHPSLLKIRVASSGLPPRRANRMTRMMPPMPPPTATCLPPILRRSSTLPLRRSLRSRLHARLPYPDFQEPTARSPQLVIIPQSGSKTSRRRWRGSPSAFSGGLASSGPSYLSSRNGKARSVFSPLTGLRPGKDGRRS